MTNDSQKQLCNFPVIPKLEFRGVHGISGGFPDPKPPFGVTSAEVAIICRDKYITGRSDHRPRVILIERYLVRIT